MMTAPKLPPKLAPKLPSVPASPLRGVNSMPEKSSRPAPSLPRLLSLGTDGPFWIGQIFVALALAASAYFREGLGHAALHPLLLLLFGLALLAALLPASGPHGQRVGLLPGLGLASVLLLPPLTAALPTLGASLLYAATRDSASARRLMLSRGGWLTFAALVGGFGGRCFYAQMHARASFLGLVVALYAAVYLAGQVAAACPAPRRARFWRQGMGSRRLEIAGFAASIPVAVLMSLAQPAWGILGVAGAAGLMLVLLVIAYFGFEVSLLREQVGAMEKISAVTLSQTDPHRIIDRFLQLSSSLVPCDRAALWLTDDSQTKLERVARRQASSSLAAPAASKDGAGRDLASLRFGEGLVGRVADRKEPLTLRDGARDPRLSPIETYPRAVSPCALLLVPLVTGGETVGVAQFERDAPGTYSRRDMLRVRSLAGQVAATIANVRLHHDIYTQAITDGLTGLFNRRHMQSALADERLRAQRYGHSLSVIMLDVDGFKSYNDTYGHPQGDVLLKMLAVILREQTREVDIVGRYGGEEFIILLPETPKTEALRTAERLRCAVEAAIFPGFADDPEMAVLKTISLGVATFPADAEEMPALVKQADDALYRAKHGGRNQVVEAFPAPRFELDGLHQ